MEDGATLQMGIGAIPDAVLARLHDKRDLGIHTEMFSDRLVDLVESGVVTNRLQERAPRPHRRPASSTGTRRLFDFVDDNPLVEFHPCDRTNDTALIRKNDKVHRDQLGAADRPHRAGVRRLDRPPHLLGHRRADGLHPRRRAVAGRQADHRAAVDGGAAARLSRIVAELKPGAGVVTTRGHVHWVVTEYGAVNLHGMTLRERGGGADLDRASRLPGRALEGPGQDPSLHVRVRAGRVYLSLAAKALPPAAQNTPGASL